jgi:outer membrane protein insertion porin family
MRKVFFFFIFLATALYSTEIYENKKVAKIDVIVESADPEISYDINQIKSLIKTKEGDVFSQLIFDNDLKTLSKDYDRINPQIHLENDEIHLNVTLWPRPLIRKINFTGNKQFSSGKLKSELDVDLGTAFNRYEFNKSLNKIKEFYIKKGFFESSVNYTAEPIERKNEVVINVTVKEGRTGHVQNIVLKGFSKDEESDILSLMVTKKYHGLTSWLTGNGILQQEALDQDQAAIINYLQNKGYADAKVDIKVLENKLNGRLSVEITATKGLIYHFGKITFIGNQVIPDKEILNCFTIHTDEIYSPEQIRQTAEKIKEYYGQRGYIEAQVNFEAHLAINAPLYEVDYAIDEGEIFKIGLIKIIGNTHTNTDIILRESLLVPGEKFDNRKLKATQERLQNIQYFKNVNVYAVKSADDLGLGPNYRDVYIEVEETTTGSANLSVGISTTENINGGLEINERNFNFKGLGKLFSVGPSALRGGGEYLQFKVNIGAREQAYLMNWMTPYVKYTLWRFGFEASITQSKLQTKNYTINTYGFQLSASHPITSYWSFGAKYRLRDASNKTDSDNPQEVQTVNRDGWVSAVAPAFVYDSTDNPIKPHRGIRSVIEAELAALGGPYHFWKLRYINNAYQPLWTKATMKYRADFQFIVPILGQKANDIPLSERFFLGGETSVRGYKPYILGPHFANNDPMGGLSSILLSVECSQEIIPAIDIFCFADAGAISMKVFDFPSLRASTGIGAKVVVMGHMPLIFGWGYPINAERESDKRKFFFSMGGQF